MNNMIKEIFGEVLITILLVVLSIVLLNPYIMPMGFVLYVPLVFIILFGGFVGLVWRENGGDERDALLRYISARVAYLIGLSISALGIIYEMTTKMEVSGWLVAIFLAMVIAKTIGFIYAKLNR